MAEKVRHGCSGVAGERILEGEEVSVLERFEELFAEDSVNVTTFVVFLTLFGVLVDNRLLVKGGFPCRDAGCETWVGRSDEGVSGDEGVLCCCEEDPEVVVLDPTAGTLG